MLDENKKPLEEKAEEERLIFESFQKDKEDKEEILIKVDGLDKDINASKKKIQSYMLLEQKEEILLCVRVMR